MPRGWTARPTRLGTFVTMLLSGAFVVGALSPFAPAVWHDTPSLIWLNKLLPYWCMSLAFVVYLVLLAIPHWKTRIAGYAVGLAAYTLGLIALCVTVRFDRPTNPLIYAAVLLAVDVHMSQLLLSIKRLVDLERQERLERSEAT